MKQEVISCELVSDVINAKSAMFTTMNKEMPATTAYKGLGGDKTIHRMLLNTHSPCNVIVFHVKAWVTDRVHTHLRTHSGMNNTYFCGSSRPDLGHGEEHSDEKGTLYRLVEFNVDAKRFIEISSRRLCPSAMAETGQFWRLLCKEVFKLVPELKVHAVAPCVNRGFCVEGMTDCGYINTGMYFKERGAQRDLSNALRKDGDWQGWKAKYL